MDGSILEEKWCLSCWVSFSSNWGPYIISITKTASKKIRALICCMKFLSPDAAVSINVPYGLAWNTIAIFGLVLLTAAWNCQKSYKNVFVGLQFLHLLPFLNPLLIVKMQPAQIFSIGITMVDVHLKWHNWFHFLILEGCLLNTLIACFFCHHSQMLQRCLCQQFLSWHIYTLDFFVYRILSLDL